MPTNIQKNSWLSFNEIVKFFFDSLRNLGIAAGVLAAAHYAESSKLSFFDSTLFAMDKSQFVNMVYMGGYLLLLLAVIHYITGIYILLPKRGESGSELSTALNSGPFSIQYLLIALYSFIAIAIILFSLR